MVIGGQVIHKLRNLPAQQVCGGAPSESSGASQDGDPETPKYARMHPHLPDADSDGEPEIDDYEDYSDLKFGHWCIDGLGPQVTPQGRMLITDLGCLGKVDCQQELHSFFRSVVNVSMSLGGLQTMSSPSSITWDILSPLQTVNKLLDECTLWEKAQSFANFRHMMALVQLMVYVNR